MVVEKRFTESNSIQSVRRPINKPEATAITKPTVHGTTRTIAALKWSTEPGLVLPLKSPANPMSLWPFDVASTEGSTNAEVDVALSVLVENVRVSGGVASFAASSVRNTRAKLGAGTVMEQVFAVWSH